MNEAYKKNEEEIAGFLMIDNRLMAKKDITIQQKYLLAKTISMMESTGKFYASNKYLTAVSGINKKTIGQAFKVFNDRGWMQHRVLKGGGRRVTFNSQHKANYEKYLGTVEEYKKFTKSLHVEEFVDEDVHSVQIQIAVPQTRPEGIKVKVPPTVEGSFKNNESVDFELEEQPGTASPVLVELPTNFGEPNTIEFCYKGLASWTLLKRDIHTEIEDRRDIFPFLSEELIRRACAGEDVDTGNFGFRLAGKLAS